MGERTAEEWGRIAVSLPGWRWMPGMLARLSAGRLRVTLCGGGQLSGLRMGGQVVWSDDGVWPDPDDPATAGCLLALLEPAGPRPYRRPGGLWVVATVPYMETYGHLSLQLGRACIAAAEALGRWPGGGTE